ncbi:two-component sensor histidine kinase [Deinococcus piscis]|uniref:histidine kinase n=1 Tax=Deinococcus piscis TaxID=394230 RepID=A0ABQ3K3B3_9DEIO|nr:HAMP domain-containing sensor histidine kinase [Deinococcus piscis]GHG01288.1 two-component sensor histidine kinase [Deinococcus piscis]
MLDGFRQRWRGATLRHRLTTFYTTLLVVLLLLTALTVQTMMRHDLERSLENDLADTQTQFTELVPSLQLALGPTDSDGLAEARSKFPSSVIQVDPLVARSQTGDLQSEWSAAQDEQSRLALLDFLHRQSEAFRLRPVGIDPAAPLQLSDHELTQLLESPSGQILINRSVKPQFADPEPMRILVSLTPLKFQQADGSSEEMLAVTFIGRSLSSLNRTVTRLQLIMGGLLLLGSFLAAIGAYVLAGWALRPLNTVRHAVEGIDSQNLQARVPVPDSDDEVEALAVAFNRMLSRLEDSFETQRRFSSDASHELRTPVTAIGGHATYLLRRTELNAQQRESIQIIQRESARMTDLIGSLLQLARSDGGVLQLKSQLLFSQMLLQEIARELRPLAESEGAVLVPAGQDIPFEADPDRLRQVLNNLISNALKAGATRIELGSTQPKPGRVRLSVSDNGPGIAADQLEKLFDRFYRLEDSRSRDRGGAGLGLSIARTIVDAHGGHIWLESQLGQGTQAYVDLPVGNLPALDDDDIP